MKLADLSPEALRRILAAGTVDEDIAQRIRTMLGEPAPASRQGAPNGAYTHVRAPAPVPAREGVLFPVGVVRLALPLPPILNHYWKPIVGRTRDGKPCGKLVLGREGRDYKHSVRSIVGRAGVQCFAETDRLALFAELRFNGTATKRDVDGRFKALLDSLSGCVYPDDSQLDDVRAVRAPPDPGNPRVDVHVWRTNENGPYPVLG